MNPKHDMLLKYFISAIFCSCNFLILFLFLLGFCLNELFINMIAVMKSLLLEAEISQYPIMVSDKSYPKCLDLISSRCLDKSALLVVMFFRFVTSAEIQMRTEFFEPFILGLTNTTVEQVCSTLKFL